MQTVLTTPPSWAKRPKIENLILDEAPLFVRCKGDTGEFLSGTHLLGKEIDIQVLGWRWIQEARWGSKIQWWLDVAFANPSRVICIASFRKQGACNIAAKLKSYANQTDTAIALHSLWLKLGFVEQVLKNKQIYYVPDVVGHRWATEDEYGIAEIFLEDQVESGQDYLWVIPGEA